MQKSLTVKVTYLTFFKQAHGLTVGKDTLDVDSDGPLRGVLAPDDGEAEGLVPGPLLEGDVLDAVGLLLVTPLAGQRTETGTLYILNNLKIIR